MRTSPLSGVRALAVATSLIAAPWSAIAETPTPDRPSVSRQGFLIAENTVELESGVAWSGDFGAPMLLKAAVGRWFEPRIGADLAGLETGFPSLQAGFKVGFVQSKSIGLAAHLHSAVPVRRDELWHGEVGALLTGTFPSSVSLQGNLGARFWKHPADKFQFRDVHGALLVAFPIVGHLGAFVEGSAGVGTGGLTTTIADVGLGWNLTENLVLDGAFGWEFIGMSPAVQLGLSANFGRLRP